MSTGYLISPPGIPASSSGAPNVFDPARPPAQLADDIDPTTGDLRSLFSFVSPVTAAVQYQFTIERGSGACVLDQGQAFKKIRKNVLDTKKQLEDEIDRILRPFVRDKLIVVDERIVRDRQSDSPSMGAAKILFHERVTGTFGEVNL